MNFTVLSEKDALKKFREVKDSKPKEKNQVINLISELCATSTKEVRKWLTKNGYGADLPYIPKKQPDGSDTRKADLVDERPTEQITEAEKPQNSNSDAAEPHTDILTEKVESLPPKTEKAENEAVKAENGEEVKKEPDGLWRDCIMTEALTRYMDDVEKALEAQQEIADQAEKEIRKLMELEAHIREVMLNVQTDAKS